MISERDANVIAHINAYCDQIIANTRMFDNSYDIIMGNSLYRDGWAMESRQISELSKLLTHEFTQAHGNMPWKTIKGLRVILAHHYYKLDKNIMWNTLLVKIPELKIFCSDILAQSENISHVPQAPEHGPNGPKTL
jgi:uncharacterized protein with HEPN domain